MDSAKLFVKNRIPETLLLLLATVGLYWTILYGFHTSDAVRANPVVLILWPAVLLVLLTAFSYSPKFVVGGAVTMVVGCVVGLVIAGAVTGQNPLSDSYENPAFPFLLGFIIVVLSYLCTRKTPLCLLYCMAGCISCGLVQFLYLNSLWVQTTLFLLGSCGFYILKRQRARIPNPAKEDVAGIEGVAVAALACVAALAASCIVFFFIVAPLNPPALQVKLFTEEYALEEVHVYGFQNVEHKINKDLSSSKAEESDNTTKNESDNTNDVQQDPDQKGDLNKNNLQKEGTSSLDAGEEESMGLLRYLVDVPLWLLIPLAVIVLLAFVVGLRLVLRKRTLAKIERKEPLQRVLAYQQFFDSRLKLLGHARPQVLTPLEFAYKHQDSMAQFEDGTPSGASYLHMAQASCACAYGARQPSKEDIACCRGLYGVFYKNVRHIVGFPKYLLYFFRM